MNQLQEQWEEVICEWCRQSDYEIVFEGPDRLERLPGLFHMVRCAKCGLFRQNPRLTWNVLKDYYPENYTAYKYVKQEDVSKKRSFLNEYGNWKRRRAIEQYQKGGRLLEVGCGTGSFLREVQRTNRWDVAGIEPSNNAARYVKESLGVPIYEGLFSEISLETQSFDVVVMFCVLEHLGEPIRDLQRVHKLLKTGGYLVFTIPNVKCLELKIFGKYWSGWDLPRHLYLFPQLLLRDILSDIGFEIIDERCLATSYHAFGHSLEFWSQTWEEKHPGLKKILIRIYYSWLVRLGLILPLAVLDQLKLSTNITFFVRKIA